MIRSSLRYFFIVGLFLFSCLSSLHARQDSNYNYRTDLSIDELRLELEDLKHELKTTQVELSILEERIKKQDSAKVAPSTKGSADLTQSSTQMQSLEKKIAQLEKGFEKAAADLRTVTQHANQTLTKLQTLEQEVASHEKRFEEVAKLKGTLTSISKAMSQKAPETTEKTYRVKAGDSLEKIARNQHVTVDTLKKLNNLQSDKIVIGQELKVADE